MCSRNHFKFSIALLFIAIFTSEYSTVLAQESGKLKLVTPNDYGQWESLRSYQLSNNGNWARYQVNTQDGDQTTFLNNTKTGKTVEYKNTANSVFSENSLWFAYSKVLTGKEVKKREKSKDKKGENNVPSKINVINLITNDTLELVDVVSYKFSNKESFIAMKRQKEKINTLIVKNLNSGYDVTFGNVKEFSWQDNGVLLAMLIDTDDKVGNAIQLYNPITGNLKVLDQQNEVYSGLKWSRDSDDLFVKRKVENKLYEKESYNLLFWKGLSSSKYTFNVFDQTNFKNFPDDTRVLSDEISISEDGNKVFFSTYSWNKKENASVSDVEKKTDTIAKDSLGTSKKELKNIGDDDEAPDVEIWNSKDLVIIPAQKMSRMKDIEQTKLAVWNVNENKFIALTNELVEKAQIQAENKIVLGSDGTPYDFEAMFGRPSIDVYTINTNSGEKNKVLTKVNKTWGVSPNSKYFIYLNNNDLHLFNIDEGKSTNVTTVLNGDFIDINNDHPLPQKPAFGFGGWSTDSKSCFIYDEFDVWQVFTNGSASKRITNGKNDGIVYRYFQIDRDQKNIDMKKPVYFSLFGKWTKKSGYASGVPGKTIKTLIFEDANISRPSKAKKADKIIFTKQSFEQSANVFLSNLIFENPKQISNTNAFQKDYAWGKAELVEYKNALGKTAQGILYYPANFEKGKKYPMITYVYEKLSDGLHRYQAPSRTDYYNTAVWTQNGYFVLSPDIDFIAGDPGVSATKTLEKAVAAVVNLGDVDAKKVGLIGHSWGGYQAGYVPTQTNIFAATVAGAGLTDLVSMNLAITPAFGGKPENNHFEIGQERMNSAPWVSPENYMRNSSVMQIEKLNTPILFEVGDNDQNVNWSQGIAYYNAARRAAKPFVLLVYAKEGHGLRNEKNKIDYQQRILKWFGHYLKDEEAEDWVTEGIPYAEQLRRLKKGKNK